MQVFCLCSSGLLCFDALGGEEMFRIKSVSRVKKNPEEAEEGEDKEDQEEADHSSEDQNDEVVENPKKRLKTEANDKEEEER